MALLLHIDTATEHASVCLSSDEQVLGLMESGDQKNHASFLQPAIRSLFSSLGIPMASVDAIAVTGGPGSYTGLRVGLASAKGLAYIWKKPLIMLGTLEVMAQASIGEVQSRAVSMGPEPGNEDLLFCPMIDARRMEVFAAIYDQNLRSVLSPTAIILSGPFFADQFSAGRIIFSGSGSIKLRGISDQPNHIFSTVQHNASHMVSPAGRAYSGRQFADIAYSEPFYLKEFFRPVKK